MSTSPGRSPGAGFIAVTMRVQARDALVALGWKNGIARAAVEQACAHVSTNPHPSLGVGFTAAATRVLARPAELGTRALAEGSGSDALRTTC